MRGVDAAVVVVELTLRWTSGFACAALPERRGDGRMDRRAFSRRELEMESDGSACLEWIGSAS